MDLWQELPFSDSISLSQDDENKYRLKQSKLAVCCINNNSTNNAAEVEENNAVDDDDNDKEKLNSLDQYTYKDYHILPCDYVIRPADILLCGSILDSHSDYQGYMDTMPMTSPPMGSVEYEEEYIKIAKRIALIQHLPMGVYDGCVLNRECVICMIEFILGDRVRYLPCTHTYHVECINNWLMRSFTCPSCLEPVDAALFNSYETT